MQPAVTLLSGALVGFSLGLIGGGGSMLAVPLLGHWRVGSVLTRSPFSSPIRGITIESPATSPGRAAKVIVTTIAGPRDAEMGPRR